MAALRASRSGKRIAVIERTAGCDIIWDNTTPEVGAHPDSQLAPDPAHVRRVLARHRPDVVIALGRQAALTLTPLWSGPLLVVPHPAFRLLTDRLYRTAGRLVADGGFGRIELVQLKGRYRRVALEPRTGMPT